MEYSFMVMLAEKKPNTIMPIAGKETMFEYSLEFDWFLVYFYLLNIEFKIVLLFCACCWLRELKFVKYAKL